MFAGLAPARRRLVLLLIAAAVAVAVATGIVVWSRAASQPAPVSQAIPGPVLLVPGYGGSTGSLESLAARLRTVGREATIVDPPGDGTGDLAAAATVLGTAAQAALQRTRATSVDVVGYSAGGIVARLWVADGGAAVARRVLTLGSPNHGTTLADLATAVAPCPEAWRQLTTTSDVIRRLNAGDETPDGPTWVSIWTTHDETVTPPDTARLDGAVNVPVQLVCPDAQVQHSGLPSDPLVQRILLAELGAGDPVALSSADCPRLRS